MWQKISVESEVVFGAAVGTNVSGGIARNGGSRVSP